MRSFVSLLAVGALAAGCASTPAVKQYDLAVVDVTVIDPETRSIGEGRTVLIDAGRIVQVVEAGSQRFVADETIDGTGRYVIPGLMDMHVHTAVAPVTEASFKLFIANGVTGVRDMSGDCWEPRGEVFLCIDQMRDYAARIENGEIVGPRLLSLASPIVQSAPTWQLPDDPDPAYSPITAEQGRALARSLNDRGVDLIKTYDRFAPDAYAAMLEEANALGLEVSGHLPIFVTSAQASQMGHRTIEHARDLLTDCSRYGATYREGNLATLRGDEGATWPKQEDLRQQSVSTFDPEICADLMAELVAHDTYYVPTHGTREMDVRAREAAYRNDPRLRFMHPFVTGDWKKDLEQTAAIPDSEIGDYRRYYKHGLRITKFAADAGVKVMIGTDANDTMMFPGFGVHDEMRRFAEAGIGPMEILRAATTIPAEYLGRNEDLGGVRAGKMADLVILDASPLEDISNSTSIHTVVFGGRVHRRSELDDLLAQLQTEFSKAETEVGDDS